MSDEVITPNWANSGSRAYDRVGTRAGKIWNSLRAEAQKV